MKKKLLAGAGAAVIGITSIAGLGVVHAATTSTSGQASLVDKIAQKFNVDKSEVQKVFDEEHAAHETEMQAKAKEQLAQAVTDGKLTQAQADLITAKRAEMHAYMDSLKDKTEAERKAAMDTKRDELKKWMTDNNIPEQYMHGPGGHGHGGHGGPDGRTTDDTSSTTN